MAKYLQTETFLMRLLGWLPRSFFLYSQVQFGIYALLHRGYANLCFCAQRKKCNPEEQVVTNLFDKATVCADN